MDRNRAYEMSLREFSFPANVQLNGAASLGPQRQRLRSAISVHCGRTAGLVPLEGPARLGHFAATTSQVLRAPGQLLPSVDARHASGSPTRYVFCSTS